MSNLTRNVDVYSLLADGKRYAIAMSEQDAWDLRNEYDDEENAVRNWEVDCTQESVPIVHADIVEGNGEMVELDDEGGISHRENYTAVKVFWHCPHCGEHHTNDLYDHPIRKTATAPNPSLWFCERGEGIVLVGW